MHKFIRVALLAMIVAASGCAPSRVVQPLKKGERAVNAAVGGPLINQFGTTIPVPFTSITYAQGISDNATVFGSLHTTSLLFGNVQGELGLTRGVLAPDSTKRWMPGLSATPVLNVGIDVWEGRPKLWPQFDVNAYWMLGRSGSFVYTGIGNWFELSTARGHGEPQEYGYIWNPHAGLTLNRPHWQYNLEAKYLAPTISNQELVVDYAKPFGSKGALGIFVSFTRKL